MRSKPVALLLTLAALACLAAAPAARAEGWHSEQPVTNALGVPTPLGEVGDIEFWAPNRGVLITQGNEANPAGVYAYDGTGWHLYSSECGGHQGRIAWEGPDSFWTISDQRPGQAGTAPSQFWRVSLCHFVDGQIVASYAEPLGQPTSYLPMNAAVCAGPNDCWFAGERLPGTVNVGAFHLHWDGTSLTAVPSLTVPQPGLNDAGRKVTSLAVQQGRLYESVQARPEDTPAPGEDPTRPYLLHRIVPTSSIPFPPITTPIELGPEVKATEMEGLRLSSDGSQLWAVAGVREGSLASPIALRLTTGAFVQPTLQGGVLEPGDHVGGVAAEPGSDHAWVSYFGEESEPARLAEVHADGTVDSAVELPGPAEGIGRKGVAGPIACPAAGQCWMATKDGWLFHLGGGLPQDTDPAMHVVITTRPADNGQPFQAPDEPPADDSGAEAEKKHEEPDLHPLEEPGVHRKKAIVFAVHQHLHGNVLELAFKLRARAHVRLLAKRKRKVVAKTRRYTMGRGPHKLHLRLDPKNWPTGLDFQVHAAHGPRFGVAEAIPVTPRKQRGEEAAAAPAPAPASTTAAQAALTVAAEAAGGSPIAEAVIGTPGVTFLGASPAEAPGEVWGVSGNLLYRYTDQGGWQPFEPVEASGQPVPGGVRYRENGSAAGRGRTTPAGGVAVLAAVGEGKQALVVRDPGGPAHLAPEPGAAMPANEVLFGAGGPLVDLAAYEAPGGHTGAFVAPARASSGGSIADGILRYDGTGWTREPICIDETGPCEAPTSTTFQVLAIDATGETNAWLLAKGGSPTEGVVLFRRVGEQWRRQGLGGTLGPSFEKASVELPQPEGPPAVVTIAPRVHGQPLTVTAAGVWIDVELTVAGEEHDGTIYYAIPTEAGKTGAVEASWCDLPAAAASLCTYPLGSELPAGEGRSFAWPPDSGDPYGRRVITGVGGGAILDFVGTGFIRQPLLGGEVGAADGAALSSADEGWLGAGNRPVRLTPSPQPSNLVAWAVPFRHPLTAVAPAPGAPVAGLESEALAVGLDGEVARYRPGLGWQPESLLTGSGARATPLLRSVAWPTPSFAYAVGDGGEMWMWRAATGLWEADPGKPPNLIRGNFTAIAFAPGEPERGYAVGQQGLLLGYGRQWTQEPLPAGVDPEANFTSLAFAGGEALLAYSYPVPVGEGQEGNLVGGVMVNDGHGWQVEEGAAAALDGDVPAKIAALPDGGAVIVGTAGTVVEREGAGAPWQRVAQTVVQSLGGVAAVAAYREGGAIRALVAGEGSGMAATVSPQRLNCPSVSATPECEQLLGQPPAGQAPLLTRPFILRRGGYLLRQTATGWQGEQRGVNPLPQRSASGWYDLPRQPDPLAALLVSPDGSQAWAVGGVTGVGMAGNEAAAEAVQTAGVYRYPADAAPANAAAAPIAPAGAGEATLAIGGDAACVSACADDVDAGIGPDVWLPHAIQEASGVSGVRAFLYTGPGVASGLGSSLGTEAFGREEEAFASRLASSNGVPVYAAPGAGDLDRAGSLATFAGKLTGLAAPQGGGAAGGVTTVSAPSPGHAYFSFDSTGTSGTVRVVVLDYSQPTLGGEQRCWLAAQLGAAGAAGVPAVVVGNRDLAGQAENAAADAAEVVPILVNDTTPAECPASTGRATGASAYFFDYPGQNRTYQLSSGGRSIPAFGSGTLGYDGSIQAPNETDFVGASGFLLAAVDVAARNPTTNVAPVTARLIPNVSELALDATDGTLLRRSSTALFEALARRPKAGGFCRSQLGGPESCESSGPDPYIPIPSRCQGARCGSGLLPEYRFTSSNPEIADFVEVDPASTEGHAVLLGPNGRPIPDPSSGLLCAYNAGTTTVSVETGGLSYSTEVTVQPGSVQRPCGTVPLRQVAASEPSVAVPPAPPGPAPEGGFTPTQTQLPPPPPPTPTAPAPVQAPAPAIPHPHAPPPPPVPPPAFFAAAPSLHAIVPIVPPPPPPAAQPTPPSGTSPVTQPAVSPEPEEEDEAAFDVVHHAVAVHRPPRAAAAVAAYPFERRSGGSCWLLYALPALALAAALSSCGIADRRRRRAPEPAVLHHYAKEPPR